MLKSIEKNKNSDFDKKNEEIVSKQGIYSPEIREDLVDKGAIDSGEDGFMHGYNNPEEVSGCEEELENEKNSEEICKEKE